MISRSADAVDGFRSSPLRTVHEWAAWSLVRGDFTDPDGERFTRTFVQSPGAVGIVALQEGAQRRVVLVRQYRPTLHQKTLEIPAGMRDQAGENPLVTAKRELREEVGLEAGEWVRLGMQISAVGITDSTVELYLARKLREVPHDRHGPEERHMTVEEIPFQESIEMVLDGRIQDAKTVTGLLLTERLLRQD
ncbi:MAG: putative ADP-ribose pyrophosphatase [Actinomycetota bacterium]|jgi:ADP-ribose pyrophosphatase